MARRRRCWLGNEAFALYNLTLYPLRQRTAANDSIDCPRLREVALLGRHEHQHCPQCGCRVLCCWHCMAAAAVAGGGRTVQEFLRARSKEQ